MKFKALFLSLTLFPIFAFAAMKNEHGMVLKYEKSGKDNPPQLQQPTPIKQPQQQPQQQPQPQPKPKPQIPVKN
jgi:hypothetical protein